jgi:hypothetical protein
LDRLTACIQRPASPDGQEGGANSPKGEFLGAVTGLKPSLAEFGHPLDHNGQAWRHRRLTPFVFYKWGKHHLLRLNMHIHQEPLLLTVLPGTLEGGIDILLITVMVK